MIKKYFDENGFLKLNMIPPNVLRKSFDNSERFLDNGLNVIIKILFNFSEYQTILRERNRVDIGLFLCGICFEECLEHQVGHFKDLEELESYIGKNLSSFIQY